MGNLDPDGHSACSPSDLCPYAPFRVPVSHLLMSATTAGLSGVEAGRYRIINCGPKTEQLVTLLHILRQTLGPVSDDAASSPTSNAYNTFFKHVAYAPYVRQILQFIADGIAISSNNDGDANSPIIICSTATKQITYEQENGEIMDAHTKCTTQASVLSFSLINSPYKPTVVLCPGFFYEAPVPSMSKENCLTVEPHFNLFRQNGAVLVRYQLWALMHELAHLYIFAHNGGMVDIYTVNGCLALIAHQAAQNAQSFIYYAASECRYQGVG